MRWLLVAFVFVFCFVAFQTQSPFLSFVALGMILVNMIPTFALYVLVCRQTYFGVLQILSLFLIMGIGVDNVFVLLECYRQHRDHGRPLAIDLSVAWHSAAKAMLCTSATTCFSFLANATSSFPAIYTFGLWCCCLIVVNYISVNTLYLATVSVFDAHFAQMKIGFSLPSWCSCWPARDVEESKEGRSHIFFESHFPRLIKYFRVPLVLAWVFFFAVYVVGAAHLVPDPEAPKLLPEKDPYMQWTDTLVEHFGALENPKLITVKLVFGIDRKVPIDRQGTNPSDVKDRGTVNWSSLMASDAEWEHAQTWLHDLCTDLERKSEVSSNNLKIRSPDHAGKSQVQCIWSNLKQWAALNEKEWPAPTYVDLAAMVSAYFRSSDAQNPQDTNYDRWSGNMFFVRDDVQQYGVTPKLFTIDIKLNMQADSLYEDGLTLWDEWEAYCEQWRASAPPFLQKSFYFTDIRKGAGAFHWFFLQDKITSEAFVGMGLALGFACIVLMIATRNAVVAACAIACITSVVSSVMAFMFCLGWKLGVLEALVLVMVIGLSVDYVVHMADAYLEAPADDRLGRTKFMLAKMGMAVVNGGITTLGAAGFMCCTYITFFQKFGIVILATVFQSLATSLFFFSAMMALFGPEGTCGTIHPCSCTEVIKKCKPQEKDPQSSQSTANESGSAPDCLDLESQ
jgi:hypothetical protein